MLVKVKNGGEWVPVTSIQGPTGPAGPKGETGAQGPTGEPGVQGPAGPNELSTTTATAMTGILKGNGAHVAQAVAGTDYAATDHTHAGYLETSGGALTGAVTAHAGTDYTTARVRSIALVTQAQLDALTITDADNGTVFVVYEEA